jgi:hypothetical protein
VWRQLIAPHDHGSDLLRAQEVRVTEQLAVLLEGDPPMLVDVGPHIAGRTLITRTPRAALASRGHSDAARTPYFAAV